MDNSFYLKNGSVLWNGAFTPLDMAVEDGHITALSRGHHNEKGLPEVDAAGLRVLPGFLDLHTHGAAGVDDRKLFFCVTCQLHHCDADRVKH